MSVLSADGVVHLKKKKGPLGRKHLIRATKLLCKNVALPHDAMCSDTDQKLLCPGVVQCQTTLNSSGVVGSALVSQVRGAEFDLPSGEMETLWCSG